MKPFLFALVALTLTVGTARADVTCVDEGTRDPWQPLGKDLAVPRDRGRLLGCVHVASVSAAMLSASPHLARRGRSSSVGYEQLILQYVTQGPPGHARRVTALAYVPTGKGPFPVVAVNHGTSGVGPTCGPSHRNVVSDYLALPLVAAGYAVVATDYPGMGVDDGISPYLVGEAAAFAILDGVRALKQLRGSRLTDELFLLGHSQGGQTTLFAEQYWDATVGMRLLGAIALAPGWGDLRGLGSVLGDPERPTDMLTLFVLYGLYGDMTYHGAPAAATWLTPRAQARLPSLLHDQCVERHMQSIPAAFPRQKDLFTREFMASASRCSFTGTACPTFEPWASDIQSDVPGAFRSDVPVLLLQGDADAIVPPYTAACVAARLRSHGTPVAACGYPGADHFTIAGAAIDDALAWMAARRRGATADVCRAPLAAACP